MLGSGPGSASNPHRFIALVPLQGAWETGKRQGHRRPQKSRQDLVLLGEHREPLKGFSVGKVLLGFTFEQPHWLPCTRGLRG